MARFERSRRPQGSTWLAVSAAVLSLSAFVGGACATPPETELLAGLPCDQGRCSEGFECDVATNRCVAPMTGSAGQSSFRDASAAGGSAGSGRGAGGAAVVDGSLDATPGDGGPSRGGSGAVVGSGGRATGGQGAGGFSPSDSGAGGTVTASGGAPATTCSDRKRDGSETDVDCGGPNCPACHPDARCSIDLDCASGRCGGADGGTSCQAPACDDGVGNGGETDVDCGGPTSCQSCGVHEACFVDGDCVSGHCVANECVIASCTDGRFGFGETATDCGGAYCAPCAHGMSCLSGADCRSGVCSGNGANRLCQQPSCTDGVENGTETDKDCGGADCSSCSAGKFCAQDGDCASGSCTQVYALHVCTP